MPANDRATPATGTPPGPFGVGTELIGRSTELVELSSLLDRVRLVTVVGLAGSGKSCLAAAVADHRAVSYAEGAMLVAVGDDPWGALAAALDDVPADGGEEEVVAALAGRRQLLVLDGADEASRAVASIATRLAEQAPQIDLLVTARHALGVVGEQVWPVPPLALPDPETDDLDAIRSADAVALFVERARAADPGFVLDEDNAARIVSLCRQLDGSPLAIALAAGRAGVLDLDELADRLHDRFHLLSGGAPSLREAVACSYEDALPRARLLLDRLAVFEGTFSLKAAERLGAGGPLRPADVLDLVGELVAHSLITVDKAHRYRLPATVRAYALDRLAERGELTQRRDQHAWYALEVAEEAFDHRFGGRQGRWVQRLRAREHDLAGATRWAVEAQSSELAQRLVGALAWHWQLRGFAEGATLAQAATRLEGAVDEPVRLRARLASAWLTSASSRAEELAAVVAAADEAGCGDVAAEATLAVAQAHLQSGDTAAAAAGFEAALTRFERLAVASGRAWAQLGLATAQARRGKPGEAAPLVQQALGAFRRADDAVGRLEALFQLGDLARARPDVHAAVALHREALALARELGAVRSEARCLEALAVDAAAAGDLQAEQGDLEVAVRAWRRTGSRAGQARTMVRLAEVRRRDGDHRGALALLQQALRLTPPDNAPAATATVAAALSGVAAVAVDAEQPQRAAVLAAAATSLAGDDVGGSPLPQAGGPLETALRHRLESDELATLQRSGAALSRDEAVAIALTVGTTPGLAASPVASGSHPVRRQLDEIGERREVRVGGISFAGRRRRPSGEREPLPRDLRASGKLWLLVGVGTALLWASLFAFPASADWWTRWDLAVLQRFVDLRTGWGVDLAQTLHALGSWWLLRPLRWATLAVLAVFRRWRHLAVALLSLLLLGSVVEVMSTAIARPRPLVPLLAPWEGYAHPSAPVAALAVTFAVMVLALVPPGRWRRRSYMLAGAGVTALGFARLYLGVDHPTDMLVGAVLGPAVAVVLFRLLAPESVFPVTYRRGRAAHLDIGGRRGEAIRQAVRDQLGLEVRHLEHFGLEASGGSTPLRIQVDGDPDRWLFGKLYSTSHLRADRWYKAGRTILYGSLEDEVRYTSVRRLVEHEDYLLLTMREADIPCARPYGVVEITPEREYLLLTEFIEGAREVDDVEVDDDLIDQGLLLVRRLWDAGLAHRDIKPGNVLVQGGRMRLIDVAFGMVRPSPWRQAVDLANMMIILALRTDADRVYARALRLFAPGDIAEAFAATRSVTIPSQSRSSLRLLARTQGLDLVERFRDLSPECEPISIQRWSRRRVALTIGALVGVIVALDLMVLNLTGAGFI